MLHRLKHLTLITQHYLGLDQIFHTWQHEENQKSDLIFQIKELSDNSRDCSKHFSPRTDYKA